MAGTTKRLYYDDSYLRSFKSTVLERTSVGDRPGVILAESAFYPTSGGQPNDFGTLNGIRVLDVVANEENAVVHVTEQPIDAAQVDGELDWQRRFDHMQHHSGQHVLSRAFIEIADAETVSFHLSENSVTIDLNRNDLTPEQVDAAEDLANQIVVENRPVRAWFPDADELAKLPLRKISDKVTGAVRVIDIGGFDITACGGTHVAFTGEIGMIKIVRLDRMKSKLMRVEFRCGKRALQDYREKNALLNNMAAQMTTSFQDIPEVVEKLREENKTLKKDLKNARQELMGYQSKVLWEAANASHHGNGPLLISRVFGEDYGPGDLQQLVAQLTQHAGTVALLGCFGSAAHLVFGRSADVEMDMVALLKQGLASLGTERGGGRPPMAQGGGVPATQAQVEAALAAVEQNIK